MESEAASDETQEPRVPDRVLDLLVCPSCHESLADDEGHLTCRGCGLRYPVRNGIPVMLTSEALPPERADAGPEGI